MNIYGNTMQEVQIIKLDNLDLSQYTLEGEISINSDFLMNPLYGSGYSPSRPYENTSSYFKKIWSGSLNAVNTPIELEESVRDKEFFVITNTGVGHKPKRICPIRFGIITDRNNLDDGGQYVEKIGYFPNDQALQYFFFEEDGVCKFMLYYNNPAKYVTDIYVRSTTV